MATESDNIMQGFRAGSLAAEVDRQNREAFKTGAAAFLDDLTGGILGAQSAMNFGGIVQEATDTRTYQEKIEGHKTELASMINQEDVITEVANMYLNAWKEPEFMGLSPEQEEIMNIYEEYGDM